MGQRLKDFFPEELINLLEQEKEVQDDKKEQI